MDKIIIIDDQEDILNLARYCLKDAYEVLIASNGRDGLELIRKEIPDLVLLDMHMPVVSGYDVVKKIKSEEKIKHITVVAITASVSEANKEKMEEVGCDYYISKPFDPEKLESKIKEILAK
ncbi:hypothetical protein MNBD_BACTEROID05-617 [hydrothermal vent metagenome]|uniref:Response regulatory domain-containing protein n=1 Tax=hydrothermal vent metagenome TaxID=652676 RepID=A0A3B0U1T2_9ZZZZ